MYTFLRVQRHSAVYGLRGMSRFELVGVRGYADIQDPAGLTEYRVLRPCVQITISHLTELKAAFTPFSVIIRSIMTYNVSESI